MIKVKLVDNGAVLEVSGQNDENFTHVFVFDKDDPSDNMDGLEHLLGELKYVVAGDMSWNKNSFEIVRAHGDEYECEDKKCPICHPEDPLFK